MRLWGGGKVLIDICSFPGISLVLTYTLYQPGICTKIMTNLVSRTNSDEEVILQWTIGTNVAFISSYLLARIPLVSCNRGDTPLHG